MTDTIQRPVLAWVNIWRRFMTGTCPPFIRYFSENGLVRIQFIVGRASGKTPKIPRNELERQITAITRTWSDRLRQEAGTAVELEFPLAYQEHVDPKDALGDIELLSRLQQKWADRIGFPPGRRRRPGRIETVSSGISSTVIATGAIA